MPASRRGSQPRTRAAPYSKKTRDAGGASKPVSGLFGSGLPECFTSPPLIGRQGAEPLPVPLDPELCKTVGSDQLKKRSRRLSYSIAIPSECFVEPHCERLTPTTIARTSSRNLEDELTAAGMTDGGAIRVRKLSYVEPAAPATGSDGEANAGLVPSTVTYTFGSATRARLPSTSLPAAAPNQDAYLTFPTFLAAEQALVGVMNGHGPQGHAVAQHVKARLPVDLVNQLLRSAAPADALRDGFAATQAGLSPKAGAALIAAQCPDSGCTATVVLLREAALAAAWVGNSRAVLALRQAPGPGGLEPQAVTRDHVLAAGCGGCGARMLRTASSSGRRMVSFAPGEPLAEDMRRCQLTSGPALSRCLGCNPACKGGSSSEPETTSMTLTRAHELLIVATDGVWDAVTEAEAVNLVGNAATPADGCQQLVDEAWHRWQAEDAANADDVTAVVVAFTHSA